MRKSKTTQKYKTPVNLSLPIVLHELSEADAKTNGRTLSDLVASLLREHLKNKGINTDAPIDDIIKEIKNRTDL